MKQAFQLPEPQGRIIYCIYLPLIWLSIWLVKYSMTTYRHWPRMLNLIFYIYWNDICNMLKAKTVCRNYFFVQWLSSFCLVFLILRGYIKSHYNLYIFLNKIIIFSCISPCRAWELQSGLFLTVLYCVW